MANKYRKRYSTSLIIREMGDQIHNEASPRTWENGWIEKTRSKSAGQDVEKRGPLNNAVGM